MDKFPLNKLNNQTQLHHVKTIKLFIIFTILASLSACLKNAQIRTDYVEGNCLWGDVDCQNSTIEQYPEYDLTFIEFTERGNLYSREDTNQVLEFINNQATEEDGAAVFVFVHGWKHNANFNDSNVKQFREFLSRAAENQVVGKRKVIGLFLGWRGDITKVPVARDLSYWARKGVAEEVGSGGVTEVFSQLNKILVEQFDTEYSNNILYKNTYVIIGHSFGSAIVLSALHDVLLNGLVQAKPITFKGSAQCKKIKRFADALVLLNPAIEANKAILLKEAAAQCQFGNDQPRLMHVLSSDGDNATKVFFPIGQYANLEQIRTAYLSFDKDANDWKLAECKDSLDECGVTSERRQQNHIPINDNDPLSFVKTDKNFIKNHNDVFGCYVQSYITAVIFETQAIDKGYRNQSIQLQETDKSETIEGCNHLDFDFKQCFNNQLEDYDCGTP